MDSCEWDGILSHFHALLFTHFISFLSSMKGKSCLTNMIAFYEDVTRRIGEGKAVDVVLVYLDFSKAFDTVSWKYLLSRKRRKYLLSSQKLVSKFVHTIAVPQFSLSHLYIFFLEVK